MDPNSPFSQQPPVGQNTPPPFGQHQPPAAPQPGYTPVPPASMPPIQRHPSKLWKILTFVFIFTTVAALGLATWALINYFDQKQAVDSKVSDAVAVAVKEQADKDAADFLEKEKQPNRQFVGPEDYGRLSFDYPKTWSIYVAKDASSGGTYEAYFSPVAVPTVSTSQQYALRVLIEEKDYDKVIDSYSNLVSKGELKSSSVTADGQTGTRLDGAFSKDIVGSAVIFKIRDKTVTLRSDAQTFVDPDFNALIQTITFNK